MLFGANILFAENLELRREESEVRGDDGGDGRAAGGAGAEVLISISCDVCVDAGAAEAMAARGEDASGGRELAVIEAEGAREAEVLVGLVRGLAVNPCGEGVEAGLDDGVLFDAVLVGELVELLDLRLERGDFVVVVAGLVAVDGTLSSVTGRVGFEALAHACGLGDGALVLFALVLFGGVALDALA